MGLAVLVTGHVHGDTTADGPASPHAVDRLLHLAMAAIAALDGVGGGRQERVVEESKGLLQGGTEELAEYLGDLG